MSFPTCPTISPVVGHSNYRGSSALKKKQPFFCGFSIGSNQYWAVRVYDLCVYFMIVTPKGSTESSFYGEAGNRTCNPWFTRHRFIPYTTTAFKKNTFCGFSMGSNQYWARRVYDLCVYYITGSPEGSTKSCFYGEAGNRTCDPWFTRHRFIPWL